jgi:hypothetical protein
LEFSNTPNDVINPYDDFGYSLMYEDICDPNEHPRIINDVEFCVESTQIYVKCLKKDLITAVDLLYFYIDNAEYVFENKDLREVEFSKNKIF